jgi:hypothetical protein
LGSDNIDNNQFRDAQIDRIITLLGDERLLNIPNNNINIDYDVFFEMLCNHIKNALTSYHIYVNNLISQEKRTLQNSLQMLKASPDPDRELIKVNENLLQGISEREIELRLESHPVFEHLNGEKMSPKFLRLAKSKVSEGNLSEVKSNEGVPFRNTAERHQHIVSTFADVYKKPPNCPENFDNLIENFLGPEICEHPLVTGSKLSPAEAALLDRPLTLQELDKAVRECKSRTAPGIDGFSNDLIKAHWQVFRSPLLEYAHVCFRKGRLTDSFNTGSIKLIPKKGDLSLIKNWRPISLLNCFYKIIARAVNYRLQSFSDRILSRAQKGFTSSRYLQEVILNVVSGIAHCNNTGTSAAVVAVDLSKAFDTIYHGFVRSAYRFFGLNNPFLNMLDTLGTNRSARIIFDDGSLSNTFPLETGRPQGGNLSPLEFNAGEQILLFKLELSPVLKSVYRDFQMPRNLYPADPDLISIDFRNESNGETDKADGFADDTTVLTMADQESLGELKKILTDFERISGLKCNFEKTNVMLVGPELREIGFITDLGYNIVNEINLLGFVINTNGINANVMYNKVLRNISGIVTHWYRYRLSLAGRIGIYKTLCLSQLSFVGSICTPPANVCSQIQEIMNNFACGTLKVARDKLYRDPEDGGLNLVNIKNFITGLQCVWVKRAHLSSRDNWRIDLKSRSFGNCLLINPRLVSNNDSCCLQDIADSFEKFHKAFRNTNSNYKECFILENSDLKRDLLSTGILNERFFSGNVPALNMEEIGKLKVSQFFRNNNLLSLDEIAAELNINFSLATYMRLATALHQYRQRFSGRAADPASETISRFWSVKGGEAKKVRKLLDQAVHVKKQLRSSTVFKTYIRLTGTVNEFLHADKVYGFWSNGFLCNKIRDFCFKYVNNQLSLNTRRSHYVANVNRSCSFCLSTGIADPPDEDFKHLFLNCPVTVRIHRWFCANYLNIQHVDSFQGIFFAGTFPETENFSSFGFTFAMTIQWLIWDMKIQKRILQPLTLNENFVYIIANSLRVSPKLRHSKGMFRQLIHIPIQWRD